MKKKWRGSFSIMHWEKSWIIMPRRKSTFWHYHNQCMRRALQNAMQALRWAGETTLWTWLSNKDILSLLAHRYTVISIRTLKRLCRSINHTTATVPKDKLQLFRRINHTSLEAVASFMRAEIVGNGQTQGYQWLHLRGVHRGYIRKSIRPIIVFRIVIVSKGRLYWRHYIFTLFRHFDFFLEVHDEKKNWTPLIFFLMGGPNTPPCIPYSPALKCGFFYTSVLDKQLACVPVWFTAWVNPTRKTKKNQIKHSCTLRENYFFPSFALNMSTTWELE